MGRTLRSITILVLASSGAAADFSLAAPSGQLFPAAAEIAETRVRQENAYLADTLLTVRPNPALTDAFAQRLGCAVEVLDVVEGGARKTGAGKAIVHAVDHPQAWRLVIGPGTQEVFRLRGFKADDFAQLINSCGFKIATSEGAAETAQLFVLGTLPGMAVSPAGSPDEVQRALTTLLTSVNRQCHTVKAEAELKSENVRSHLGDLAPEVVGPRRQGSPWTVTVSVLVGNASEATVRRLTVNVAADGVCALLKDVELHKFPAELFAKCAHDGDAAF